MIQHVTIYENRKVKLYDEKLQIYWSSYSAVDQKRTKTTTPHRDRNGKRWIETVQRIAPDERTWKLLKTPLH